jgi:hypothetical protein
LNTSKKLLEIFPFLFIGTSNKNFSRPATILVLP